MVRITCTAVTHGTTLNVASQEFKDGGDTDVLPSSEMEKLSREKELLFFTARDQPQRAMKRRQS